jgi:hypothetical protein
MRFRGSLLLLACLILLAGGVSYGRTAGNYAAADERALATPAAAERSLSSLASYLAPDDRTENERVRAIYAWITQSITYDSACFGRAQTAAEVLTERRAVCSGFASLFEVLAQAAGFDAIVIRGVAKGAGPSAAMTEDKLLIHDWNAVKIDGTWQLIDCAFGAGSLDEQGRFRPRFEDHYFLTPPEIFIFDHFPDNPSWQLLNPPLSREDFRKQVTLRPAFFRYDLRLLSHTTSWIEADEDTVVSLAAPSSVNLMSSLERNGADLGEGLTFAQRTETGYNIHIAPPRKGDYLLKIHARDAESADPHYDCVAEYRLHASKPFTGQFPKMYLSYQEEGATLTAPLQGTLQAGRATKFELHAPAAEDVLVFCDGEAIRLASQGNGIYSGEVRLGAGEAIVFARYPGQRKHLALLKYDVR